MRLCNQFLTIDDDTYRCCIPAGVEHDHEASHPSKSNVLHSNERLRFKRTFSTPYVQMKGYEGKSFKVLKVQTRPTKKFDRESLPMFQIQFKDGKKEWAWPEEVLIF